MDSTTTGADGRNPDAAEERMKTLSEERKRLLEAMLRQHAGHQRKAEEQGPAPGDAPQNEPNENPGECLVAIKASGSRPPFFCVHGILGSAFPYHRLATYLDPEQPFYGLQSPGLDGTTAPLESIEEMARVYLERVREVQPDGPYHLGGYSFGGWVAYEMAQQLRAAGEPVALLAAIGVGAPPAVSNPALFEQLRFAAQYADDYRRLVMNSFLADTLRSATGDALPPMPWNTPVAAVATANSTAQFRYIPRPCPGPVTLFATDEQHAATHPDPTMGWKLLSVADVPVHRVPGNHLNMLEEPHVKGLAEALFTSLQRAPGRHL